MTDDRRDRAIEGLLKNRVASSTTPQGGCLDAETVAAWVDGVLPAEERSAAELHTADCDRCQALLAAMATTTPLAAETRPWWRRRVAWLVPAGAAAAAALLVALLVPAGRPQPESTAVVADARSAAPAEPPAVPFSADQKEAQSELKKSPASPPRAASRNEPRRQLDRLDAASKPQAPPRAKAEETRAPTLDERASSNAAAPVQPPPPLVASPAAAAPPAQSMAKAMMQRAAIEIVSPNPGSRWRIVADGAVQRSMDGGSTWQLQQTGAATSLTAGASPAPSVCWLVGPAGIVVVSTDGRSWHRVPFPETADLTAVRAADATTATVTAADGRSFTTTDSGQTWTQNPERDR